MSPLALMNEGEKAEIVDFVCGRHRRIRNGRRENQIATMGLRPGKCVEMLANRGHGPLVVLLDETRIALGRGMAMKIYVRRKEA